MLEPLAVDPNRSMAPAANSIASARLVFPAPAGPTSAITRVPFDSPALLSTMCDSPFVPLQARGSLLEGRSGADLERFTVRLFLAEGKGGRYGSERLIVERARANLGFHDHGRQERTPGDFARGNAGAGVEGHRCSNLQAHVGRQCRPRGRGGRLLRILRLAIATWADCTQLQLRRGSAFSDSGHAYAYSCAPSRRGIAHRPAVDDRRAQLARHQGPWNPTRLRG